jgi:hypothetical protein
VEKVNDSIGQGSKDSQTFLAVKLPKAKREGARWQIVDIPIAQQ